MDNQLENLRPKLVMAYTDDEGRFDRVVEAALDVASRYGSRVVFYDASSASAFSDPIAGLVSAEGVEEQFGDPLSPEELERLGRPAIAERVVRARQDGVDAWGWLPLPVAPEGSGSIRLPRLCDTASSLGAHRNAPIIWSAVPCEGRENTPETGVARGRSWHAP
jgi:hypothetical protein